MRNRVEIEKKIITELVANQNEVTIYEPKTVTRGLITAFAGVISELWNDFYQAVRSIYLNTSSGDKLDRLLNERGIVRLGASKAGVLITFKGTMGTVIPAGTVCTNPSTGIGYVTKNQIILGTKNPELNISSVNNLSEPSIADTVWAECQVPGSIGNSQVNTIVGKPAISGVSSCSNPSPAQGGIDLEPDTMFRERGRNYISILNQGTEAAYEQWAKEFNSSVLRIRAIKDGLYGSVKVILVKDSGSSFTQGELNYIADGIKKRQRAYTKTTCVNIAFALIQVKLRARIKAGYNLSDVYVRMADALAAYFNWKNWEFGGAISVDDVFRVCMEVIGIEDIELNTFYINATNPKNASITQTLHTQVSTGATTSTITDTSASYTPDALVGKYVRILSGNGAGQTKQIIGNSSTQLTILGVWDTTPANGSTFAVIEIYILSSRTQLAISDNTLPYFYGLEITDISNPQQPVTKRIQGINQQQNQTQD
jgi:uncharacterized phage protein gp47/JayE